MDFEEKYGFTPATDGEMQGFEYTIPDGFTAEIKDGKVIVKKQESEDERIRKWLFDKFNAKNEKFVEELDNYQGVVTRDQILAYLEKQKEQKPAVEQQNGTFNSYDMAKTFAEGQYYVMKHPEKFGLCKPTEWSEEEDTTLCKTIDILSHKYKPYFGESEEIANRLKSLRPQPKQEWSEEDDACYETINVILEDNLTEEDKPEYVLSWFKSQYLRSHWKPSDEQMEALHTVCYVPELEVYGGLTYWLKELYEQLKKL